MPVETAVANLPGQNVKSDQGEVQRHVDKEGVDLPFQAHFSHVKVRSGRDEFDIGLTAVELRNRLCLVRHCQSPLTPQAVSDETTSYHNMLILSYLSILTNALFSLSVKRADGSYIAHEQVVDQLAE